MAHIIATSRHVVLLGAVVVGLAALILMHLFLPDGLARLLLDREGASYPLSVQNVMWLVFFAAIGELVVRFASVRLEEEHLGMELLPEDPSRMLEMEELGEIYADVTERADADRFLPQLITRGILLYQSTVSIEQTASSVVANTDLQLHEVDLRYSLLRYIMWLIPSLGFIGTVIGISLALAYAGEPARIEEPTLLSEVTSRLAVAFNTTLLALIMSSLLVYATSITQAREERSLNRASQYCLDNLVNKIFSS